MNLSLTPPGGPPESVVAQSCLAGSVAIRSELVSCFFSDADTAAGKEYRNACLLSQIRGL